MLTVEVMKFARPGLHVSHVADRGRRRRPNRSLWFEFHHQIIQGGEPVSAGNDIRGVALNENRIEDEKQ